MKLLALLVALLAVVVMTAIPVFGHVLPQCPPSPTDEVAQSGGYVITDLSAQRSAQRSAQAPPPRYNMGRRN
ncbi:uncharacterized protein LOC108138706 [Drosophila elegans]|uniref:uncharacterized protein LOC108138706 n=1 Tax=Drosophila elegans TaxID=30023 RepID=UPI0007E8544C|nr:uncharacterized protein LOC108138706 [Drosophila elegans]